MTDLNAPLGMNVKQRKLMKVGKESSKKNNFSYTIIAFFCAVAALNAYILTQKPSMDATNIVRLQTDKSDQTITKNTTQPNFDLKENDINIVYGAPKAETAQIDPSAQLLDNQDEITQVSPGGPRIITIRDPGAVEIGQPLAVAHLPEPSALEDSKHGKLPIRASDGRRPVDIYARPWSRAGGKRIAIVIGGLGLSQTGTQHALDKLPPEITLAFAPTGNSLNRWMRKARKNGHEILMQVPMEPFNYPQVNPGPNTLRLASSAETNLENLHWALGQTTNYTGIVNYLGARFASNTEAMAPILEDLGKRGLLYLNDGSGGSLPALAKSAHQASVPYAAGNVVIDSSSDAASIKAKLKALEALADGRGTAIGSGSALELTVNILAEWANKAKKNGFEIVGISAITNDPERRQ